MGKAPAFQLYAQDFVTDTAEWEAEEVGIYIRLLCYEWINGSIPKKESALKKIVHCSEACFNSSWDTVSQKFIEKDGRLYNKRLEGVREQQKKYWESRSRAGKKGADARWHSK